MAFGFPTFARGWCRYFTVVFRMPALGSRHLVSPTPSVPHWDATISRLLQIIGLFCKRALEKRQYSAKETYNFKEPTNRSHPLGVSCNGTAEHSLKGNFRPKRCGVKLARAETRESRRWRMSALVLRGNASSIYVEHSCRLDRSL